MRGFMQTSQKSDTLDFGDIVAKVSYAFPYKGVRVDNKAVEGGFSDCGKRGLCKVLGKKRNSIAMD